jgi:hypothetical protein
MKPVNNSNIKINNKSSIKRWLIPDEVIMKLLVLEQNSDKLLKKRQKKQTKRIVKDKKIKLKKPNVKKFESKFQPLKFVEIEDQFIATQFLFESSVV